MLKTALTKTYFLCVYLLVGGVIYGQSGPILNFDFENSIKSGDHEFNGKGHSFVQGIQGKGLNLDSKSGYNNLSLDAVTMDGSKDFSIQ